MSSLKREGLYESCLEFTLFEMVDAIVASSGSDSVLAGYKLDNIGFRVGQKLLERYTKDRPRFEEKKDRDKDLDMVKYICKDIWLAVFKKQVDNLKTNHRDKYVIVDNNFRWLKRFSAATQEQTEKQIEKYLHFPRGLIRGAMSALGLECDVKTDLSPNCLGCTFTLLVRAN